jgi:hypothetical protein
MTLHLASMQWSPLFFLGAVRVVRYARFRDALLAGIGITLATLASTYHLVFCAIGVVVLVLAGGLTDGDVPRVRSLVRRVAEVSAMLAIGAGWLIAGMVRAYVADDYVNSHDSMRFSATWRRSSCPMRSAPGRACRRHGRTGAVLHRKRRRMSATRRSRWPASVRGRKPGREVICGSPALGRSCLSVRTACEREDLPVLGPADQLARDADPGTEAQWHAGAIQLVDHVWRGGRRRRGAVSTVRARQVGARGGERSDGSGTRGVAAAAVSGAGHGPGRRFLRSGRPIPIVGQCWTRRPSDGRSGIRCGTATRSSPGM